MCYRQSVPKPLWQWHRQCYPSQDKRIDKLSPCDEVLYES